MKLALHRSITFWSGLLVIAFIGWAWWDSTRYASAATWLGPGKISNWRAANNDGAVFISRTRITTASTSLPWRRKNSWQRYPMNADSREGMHSVLGSQLFAHKHAETPYDTSTWIFDTWILSYRALILPPSAIWIALLLWRARRRKHQSNPVAT